MTAAPPRRMTASRALLIQRLLHKEPHSLAALAAEVDLAKTVVSQVVRDLRTEDQVYIAGWAPDPRGYHTICLFAWGKKADTPRPTPRRTPAERMAALRAARKENDQ